MYKDRILEPKDQARDVVQGSYRSSSAAVVYIYIYLNVLGINLANYLGMICRFGGGCTTNRINLIGKQTSKHSIVNCSSSESLL